MKHKPIQIGICLGSACYPRGNGVLLELIKDFIQSRGLQNQFCFRASLCKGRCAQGPYLEINDEIIQDRNHQAVLSLLESLCVKEGMEGKESVEPGHDT